MKMKLAWHAENLHNREKSLDRSQRALEAQQQRYVAEAREYDRLRNQIVRAVDEGKDSFDPDKYNAKRLT